MSEKWNPSVRVRLSIMMFLTYAINGIWIIPLGTYLTSVGYTGDNVGAAYSTFALGCIIAPLFVGMIADRFFSAQKILGVLNILAAVLLVLAARYSVGEDGKAWVGADGKPALGIFYWLLLGHFVAYMPSWALTNTIAMRQMEDPARQFPAIRVMGTIGWVVVGFTTLFGTQLNALLKTTENFEATATPMYIAAGISIVAGLFAFFLPATPPAGKGKKASVGEILGLKAIRLFKDRNFLVFGLASFLVFFAGIFYWNWTNVYLNETGMKYAMAWQTIGQMTETVFLFSMPFFFARFGVKKMLLFGLLAWTLRFVCFSFGDWGTATSVLVILGIALHGPCFDFFFVTGQLYTDAKAPKEIQAQAQGLISLITFGLGWYFASIVAGRVVQTYAIEGGGHEWRTVFLYPIGIAAAVTVFFFLSFWDKARLGQGEGEQAAAEGEAA